MTKKIVKNNRKSSEYYESYLIGDLFFDLLREFYRDEYSLDSKEWRSVVDNDIRLQLEKKKKRINSDRRYRLKY